MLNRVYQILAITVLIPLNLSSLLLSQESKIDYSVSESLISADSVTTADDLQPGQILEAANLDYKLEKNINGDDAIVYSSAIPSNNPEILSAKNKSIPVIRRAEMLAELISLKKTSIAVGGTHGKTSTSSMIGMLLESSGYFNKNHWHTFSVRSNWYTTKFVSMCHVSSI